MEWVRVRGGGVGKEPPVDVNQIELNFQGGRILTHVFIGGEFILNTFASSFDLWPTPRRVKEETKIRELLLSSPIGIAIRFEVETPSNPVYDHPR